MGQALSPQKQHEHRKQRSCVELAPQEKIGEGGYKGSGSELLTLLPLLEHLAHTLRDHPSLQDTGPQFDSFFAACEVGRVYMTMKRRQGGAVTTQMKENMILPCT